MVTVASCRLFYAVSSIELLEDRRLFAAVLNTVALFDGTNGRRPTGGLVADAAGILYGTTEGTTTAPGNVFRFNPQTNELTNLVTFPGTTGSQAGLLIDSAGNLYGTTFENDFNDLGDGTIFRIAAGTNVITPLHSFNGEKPSAPLIADADGNLYGTTASGGANGDGEVFKFEIGTGTYTPLADFDAAVTGRFPTGKLLLDAGGNLFGTAAFGGTSDKGTIFRVDAATNDLTAVASFDGDNGSGPRAGLLADVDGNFYGVAEQGGEDDFGSLFKVAAGSSTITRLQSFDSANSFPITDLVKDANGQLIGLAPRALFTYDIANNTLTFVAGFNNFDSTDGDAVGDGASGAVFIDSAGSVFGTTKVGGTSNVGTVFKFAEPIPPLGTFTATLPAQAVAGQKAPAKLNVPFANPSSTDAFNQNVTVRLLASSDDLQDSADAVILTATKKLKLKAGATGVIKLAIKSFPQSLATGDYKVIAEATPETGAAVSQITDSSTAVAAATVNLAGTAVGPAKLTLGKSGKLVMSVTNSGNTAIADTIQLTINAQPTDSSAPTAIALQAKAFKIKAGQTKKITATFGLPPTLAAGSYNLFAQLDTGNALTEISETDNQLISTVVSVVS